MGIALPWMCTLISLWVSEAKMNSGIAITELNYCQHYYCCRPTRFQYVANLPTHIYENTKILLDP